MGGVTRSENGVRGRKVSYVSLCDRRGLNEVTLCIGGERKGGGVFTLCVGRVDVSMRWREDMWGMNNYTLCVGRRGWKNVGGSTSVGGEGKGGERMNNFTLGVGRLHGVDVDMTEWESTRESMKETWESVDHMGWCGWSGVIWAWSKGMTKWRLVI